jgi:hypothetical protein
MIVQSVTHPVTGTHSNSVIVQGNHTSVPIHSEFRLYDDDDFGLDAPPLPRLDLVNDLMKSFFKPAFIEVVDSGGFNLVKIIPFRTNDDLGSSTVVNSGKDLTEQDALWVCQLTAASQAGCAEDGEHADAGTQQAFGGGVDLAPPEFP